MRKTSKKSPESSLQHRSKKKRLQPLPTSQLQPLPTWQTQAPSDFQPPSGSASRVSTSSAPQPRPTKTAGSSSPGAVVTNGVLASTSCSEFPLATKKNRGKKTLQPLPTWQTHALSDFQPPSGSASSVLTSSTPQPGPTKTAGSSSPGAVVTNGVVAGTSCSEFPLATKKQTKKKLPPPPPAVSPMAPTQLAGGQSPASIAFTARSGSSRRPTFRSPAGSPRGLQRDLAAMAESRAATTETTSCLFNTGALPG